MTQPFNINYDPRTAGIRNAIFVTDPLYPGVQQAELVSDPTVAGVLQVTPTTDPRAANPLYLNINTTPGGADPKSILGSSLKVWLRPGNVYSDAGITPAVAAATKIQQWNDSSGNNNHAIQVTSANQPQVSGETLNGLPVVRFTGNPCMMNQSYFGEVGVAIIVYAMPPSGSSCALVTAKSAGQTSDHASYYILSSLGLPGARACSATHVDGTTFVHADRFQYRYLWSVAGLRRKPGAGGYIGTWLGAAQIGANVSGNVNATDPAGPAVIGTDFIGSYAVNGTDISEIIIADADCTDIQYKALINYLNNETKISQPGKYLRCTSIYPQLDFGLCKSNDGINWTNVPQSYMVPVSSDQADAASFFFDSAGLLGTANRFWAAYTTKTLSSFVGVAYSDDLANWTFCRDVDCSAIGGGASQNVWAPEWFTDPSDNTVHLYIASGQTSTTQFIWEIHPTTQTNPFGTWTAPVQLVITGWGGAGLSIIDPQMLYLPNASALGPYYMFFKVDLGSDPAGKTLYATSATRTGTFTPQVSGAWGPPWTANEAGNMFNVSGNLWWYWSDLWLHQTQFSSNPAGFNNATGLFATTGWTTPVDCIGPKSNTGATSWLEHGTTILTPPGF